MKTELKNFLIYILVFCLVWIAADWVFSLLRAITFVFVQSIRSALPAAIIAYIVYRLVLKK